MRPIERRAIGLLLSSFVLSIQLEFAIANEASTPVRPPNAAIHQEEARIPVATDAGLILMTQQQYEAYVRPMGHLPVMSKAYIFGQKIPLPKTDKSGHVHVSEPAPASPRQ
jgi:hypothetical protein